MEYNTLNFLLTLIIKGIFVSIITVSFFAFVIMMNSIYKTREEEENERKRELLYGKTFFEPLKHEKIVEDEKIKISPIHEDNLIPAIHHPVSTNHLHDLSMDIINPVSQVKIESSIIPEKVSIYDLYDQVKKNQPRTGWSERLKKKDDEYDQLRSEIKAYTNLIEKEKII